MKSGQRAREQFFTFCRVFQPDGRAWTKKKGRESHRENSRPFQCSIAGKSQSDYFPAGFFAAGALVALAAPVFALVDLAAPDFALVDFGAAGFAAVLVLVVFAAGAFAAVLFAAIPIFLRGEFIDTDLNCRMPAGVGRWQPRDTNGCGEANKTHQIQPSGL